MSDKLKYLNQLVSLAQETSSSARQTLLQDVTDLFMEEPGTLNEREIESFGVILVQLAREMETKLRQHLAETIANEKAAPRRLVTALADDTIEVAGPVLTGSPVLEDTDLLTIIGKRGQEHMLAISKRSAISDRVAGSLAEEGNDRVLGSLAKNPGADLSETTMGTMLNRAEDKKSLCMTLVGRSDLSSETARRLFNNVSGAVLEQLFAGNPSLDEENFDELIEETRDWFNKQLSDDDKIAAQEYVARKEKLGQLDTDLLSVFVKNGEVWRLVAGLARLSNVDFAVARLSMFDPSGQKLAVLCKAIDMDRTDFKNVVEFTNFRKTRTKQDKLALFGIYGGMKPEPAQRALRFLRARNETATV